MHRLQCFRPLCAVVMLLPLAGCRKPLIVSEQPLHVASQHFQFDYYGLDSATAQNVVQFMEANRARVMSDLSVDTMPAVHIIMHTDSSFAARWSSVIKRSGVSFQVQGLANGVNEVHVYGPWAVQHPQAVNAVVLHEFAHAVTLQFALSRGDSSHLAPAGNAPSPVMMQDRWLSEAIALFEANQSTDLNWVGRIRSGDYPTLVELSDPSNSLIYGVGYRLIEYIRLNWGAAGVTRLILHHGNVQDALGVSPTEFEDGWYNWVVKRYLILSPKLFGSSRYSRRAH